MTDPNDVPNPFISSPFYDRMKFFTLVVLPALSALYFGLGNLWGFPKIEEVVGSAAFVGTFLGVILGISSSQFKQIAKRQAAVELENSVVGYLGSTGANEDTGIPNLSLTFTKDPREILENDTVTLKVGQAPPPARE